MTDKEKLDYLRQQAEATAAQPPLSPLEKLIGATLNAAAAPVEVAQAQPASASPDPDPADLAVITAFLKAHDFGKEHSRVRSILVEFVKFSARHSENTCQLKR